MAKILIVDDDPDILDLVQGMLTPEHDVMVSTDAAGAMDVLRSTPIDLLVTDIRMPQCNGFMLIRQAMATHPELRVIVMSAFYDETDETARQIVSRYAPIALSKPITRAAIKAAVNSAMAAPPYEAAA